jgi:hypothetical protein
MKRVFFSLFLINTFAALNGSAQPLAIGQWRTELTYRNAVSVTASDNKIYCASELTFYSVDLADGSIKPYTKVDGLSDVKTTLLSFDKNHDLLLVCYLNSNIDVIKDGAVTNISDIKRKSIVGDKAIYCAYFLGDYAYLGCGFGIVVLDVLKNEIKDTYYIGPNGTNLQVNGITSSDGYLYAATTSGIYRGALDDPFLADFSRWHLFTTEEGLFGGNFTNAVTYQNTVLASKKDSVFQFDGQTWSPYYVRPGLDVKKMHAFPDQLVITHIGTAGARTTVLYASGQADSVSVPQPLEAITAGGSTWIADLYIGLQHYSNGSLATVYPNGPQSSKVFDLAVNSQSHSVYVAPGGWNSSFGFVFNQDGFFAEIDDYWNHYDKSTYPELTDVWDFVCTAVNPSNGLVYFGNMTNGIYEFDDNLGITNQFNADNSSLSGTVGDFQRVKAADIEFDRYGNMWVSNIGALTPVCVRKPDGTWLSFAPPFPIDQQWVTNMTFDEYDQVWFILPRQGVMVFNYGQSLDDPSDDQWKQLINVPGSGNLPTAAVNCLATDKDGIVWLGTETGIAVFYCAGDVFSQFGCEAQQIIVNSGGYNGYLLATENVKRILVDGANRKWMATDNGLWLFSEDGQEQLEHFTFDNSPLISNFVNSLALDNSSGEVYIGTESGIMVYRGDATTGSTSSCAPLVFPNPVRENYTGPIAISGVVNDADVKITDANGTLIYRTTANGGQVIWDGNNYNGERAKTGVYLVWASNGDGSLTCMTKLLIIN